MRILFVMATPEYLRYYDSTIRLLDARGHEVFLAVNRPNRKKSARLETIQDSSRVTITELVPKRGDVWYPVARRLRGIIDYLRFMDPRFAEATPLRLRMFRKVLPKTLQFLKKVRSLRRTSLERVLRLLRFMERAIPTHPAIDRFVQRHRPDVVIVTPLVDAASDQVDLVKSAHRFGIPVGVGIASWDNLTNKGLMRVAPEAVFVWNQIQKNEAVDFHGIEPSRVVVTGAQLFDRWFDRTATRDRESFCRVVGLDPARKIVLFVGSTAFISAPETEVAFVRSWMAAIRASTKEEMKEAGILIRPHPYNAAQWREADLGEIPNVAIYPREAANLVDEGDRAMYFDSLYHSAAVVGINTSAMIEAAIVGRPVHTILAPEFADTQKGTLHFRYLLPEHGGFVRVARTLAEHVEQLQETLGNGNRGQEETARFVERFIRPYGLEEPCTPRLVEAIEGLKDVRPQTVGNPVWLLPIQGILWGLGVILTVGERIRKSARPHAKAADHRAVPRRKVLFLTGHFAMLRNFESVLRELAQRGVRIHVAADSSQKLNEKRRLLGGEELIQRLATEYGTITYGWTPKRKSDPWFKLASTVRLNLDYLRFVHPRYAGALRVRAGRYASKRMQRLAEIISRVPLGLTMLATTLRLVERALPVPRKVAKFIAAERPDLMVITPLLTLGSEQYDYLKTAHALGIPTLLAVTSWDHLSSKAFIRDCPDRVVVWNEIQRKEAIHLHGVPAERVAVTGAQCYDHWFQWHPRTDRDQFCRRIGLDPGKPYVLYLCSSLFKDMGNERDFIARWIERIRERQHSPLADAGVLIRPHPTRANEWAGFPERPNIAVWPPQGTNPTSVETKSDYYDSLYHCAAVVGLNTSALIEAGIVGRPVLTFIDHDLATSQTETIHFHYLREGLLTVASSLDEHLAQLETVLRDGVPDHQRARMAEFVERFVRPFGLDVPATEKFVDEVERTARAPARHRDPVWIFPLRMILRWYVRRMPTTRKERKNLTLSPQPRSSDVFGSPSAEAHLARKE